MYEDAKITFVVIVAVSLAYFVRCVAFFWMLCLGIQVGRER